MLHCRSLIIALVLRNAPLEAVAAAPDLAAMGTVSTRSAVQPATGLTLIKLEVGCHVRP
ncbi:hypothetical protein ABIA96_007035 [Bradyrhizobium sp. LB11.1]